MDTMDTFQPIGRSSLQTLFARFKQRLLENTERSDNRIVPFSIFSLVAYTLFYFVNRYFLDPQHHASMLPRLPIVVGSLLLLAHRYWPDTWRKHLPWVWHATLLYSLPFFITLMTLLHDCSAAWLFNLLSVSIVLMFLVDWVTYLVLEALGVSFAILVFSWVHPKPLAFLPGTVNLYDIINVFLISIIMGLVFSRSDDIYNSGKRDAMRLLSASIAHELRTPLAAIRVYIECIRDSLPQLVQFYKDHHEALNSPRINTMKLDSLSNALNDIFEELNYANIIINMLLVKTNKSDLVTGESGVHAVLDCVTTALYRYPFKPDQEELINLDPDNAFLFDGDDVLMVHIVLNMLSNAVYYLTKAQRGEIYIWFDSDPDQPYNTLHFKDTGTGIPDNLVPKIFDRFFTHTHHGSGLGLYFCKSVMKSFGGDIRCTSEMGQYTHFTLSFPKVERR